MASHPSPPVHATKATSAAVTYHIHTHIHIHIHIHTYYHRLQLRSILTSHTVLVTGCRVTLTMDTSRGSINHVQRAIALCLAVQTLQHGFGTPSSLALCWLTPYLPLTCALHYSPVDYCPLHA